MSMAHEHLEGVSGKDISTLHKTPIFNVGKWYFLTCWTVLCKRVSSFLPPLSNISKLHIWGKPWIHYFTDHCFISLTFWTQKGHTRNVQIIPISWDMFGKTIFFISLPQTLSLEPKDLVGSTVMVRRDLFH